MGERFDMSRPIYAQIVERLKAKILAGIYPPGGHLDSVRDMAAAAGVNPNTMQRALAQLEAEGLVYTERTTGRFVTEAGSNHKGEDIVWLDYNAALSMHRVRNVPGESRTKRLQTPTVADNRISFGCVNIPASFYDRYIDPLFSRSRGVVYVLPETKPIASLFPFADGSVPAQAVAQQIPAAR